MSLPRPGQPKRSARSITAIDQSAWACFSRILYLLATIFSTLAGCSSMPSSWYKKQKSHDNARSRLIQHDRSCPTIHRSMMMFLQYAAWGIWLPIAARYLLAQPQRMDVPLPPSQTTSSMIITSRCCGFKKNRPTPLFRIALSCMSSTNQSGG